MKDRSQDASQNVSLTRHPRRSRGPSDYSGTLYSSQDIADRYPDIAVKAVTIRTRWYEWVRRVGPESLLKQGGRYTDLGAELFDDFAQRVKREEMDAKAWVEDAKCHNVLLQQRLRGELVGQAMSCTEAE